MKKAQSTQNCDARLRINGVTYDGETGHNSGHAEMDALDQFYIATYNSAAPTTAKQKHAAAVGTCVGLLTNAVVPKTVFCPSRPCCVKCSSVLRTLGFALGTNTVWGATRMEMTEWGVTPAVAEILAQCGVDLAEVKRL